MTRFEQLKKLEGKIPLTTDGYYARRIANGERPSMRGYPANHLPLPAVEKLRTRTGYRVSYLKGK